MSDNSVEPPDSDDDDRLSESALLQRYVAQILHLREQERRRLKIAQLRQLREQQARVPAARGRVRAREERRARRASHLRAGAAFGAIGPPPESRWQATRRGRGGRK